MLTLAATLAYGEPNSGTIANLHHIDAVGPFGYSARINIGYNDIYTMIELRGHDTIPQYHVFLDVVPSADSYINSFTKQNMPRSTISICTV